MYVERYQLPKRISAKRDAKFELGFVRIVGLETKYPNAFDFLTVKAIIWFVNGAKVTGLHNIIADDVFETGVRMEKDRERKKDNSDTRKVDARKQL